MPLTENKLLKINVSDDRLTATMALANTSVPAESLSAEQIIAEVAGLDIVLDDEAEKNIAEFATALAEEQIPEPIVIARGTPPQHDENGRIEKLYGSQEPETESNKADNPDNSDNSDDADSAPDRESHYDRSTIITVAEGQDILRIIPPVEGTDGTDIYGKVIPRKLGRDAQIRLGPSVRRAGDLIIAECDGELEFTGDKISINNQLEIPGNVDFSVGNIDFAKDVVIGKNVLDLFKVRSKANITVHGIVEAAEVHAEQNLIVNGGIAGKDKGKFSAGADIQTKYISNSYVRAGGNIEVRTEIVHCDLACEGRVSVEGGPLVGGRTVARGGVKVKDLGCDAGTRTILEVGIDQAVKDKYEQIAPEVKIRRRKAEKTRQAVEPLLANQKHLTSDQKEKATELLYNAGELEDEAGEMIEQLREVYKAMQEEAVAEIEVVGTMFAGVLIRFPKVEALVTLSLKGPLKIIPHEVGGMLQVVAVDSGSGTTKTLDSGLPDDNFWENLEELLASSSK